MNQEDLITHIFCTADDFYKEFIPLWEKMQIEYFPPKNDSRKKRCSGLSISEITTILIFFHHSKFRTFKDYYIYYVSYYLKSYFPKLISYSWFISLIKATVYPMFVFLHCMLGTCTGISFIDSTIITVCHSRRISSHKVFKKLAKRGKTSTGWFYGFKLHLVINERGEILAFTLTAGNVDDRKPVPYLTKNLMGQLFGDKGYISSRLFNELFEKGVKLITRLKSKMRNQLMSLFEKVLLRRRGLIESVNNKLKFSCQIEHHRHRSSRNFLINLFSGLIAYMFDPNKPTIKLHNYEKQMIDYLQVA